MKRMFLASAAFFLILAFSGNALAAERTVGIGLVLGQPTGLTTKIFLNDENALDFDLAFDFLEGAFLLTGDYLWHFDNLTDEAATVTLRPYIGGGGVLGVDDGNGEPAFDHHDRKGRDHHDGTNVGIGARFTAGLSLMFRKAPVEIFADVSPGVWIVPGSYFNLGAVLGARYFF